MVFSNERYISLIEGFYVCGIKNLNYSLASHETSKYHENSVIAFVKANKNKDISTMLNKDQMEKMKSDTEFRRQVVRRLIDIIIFIGQQGLAYRGCEEAPSLDTCL